MEILIIVAIWSVVVKRGVEDILHTVRGGTPHRYAAAKARRESGAAGRYWSTLWSDTFDDMLAKHTERRARRQASPSTPRPRGAASQFFAGLFQDAGRSARRSWRDGWTVLDERRREKATRPRPGQETVPGEVVPNAQDGEQPMYVKDGRRWGNCDTCGKRMVLLPHQTTCAWCTYQRSGGESNPDAMRLTVEEANRWTAGPGPSRDEDGDEDRPQDGDGDGDRPAPEPRLVQDGDGRTDLRFGEDEDDPTGVSSCPECDGTGINKDGGICESCRDRQEQRNQHYEDQTAPDSGPESGADEDISPIAWPTTQEGSTMTTTIPTGEVTSLSQTIRFCEDSAQAYRAQAHAIEQTQATLTAEEVSGPAAGAFALAMEQSFSAADAMTTAADEFKKHLVVLEAYDAVQGAGTKAFVTGGR